MGKNKLKKFAEINILPNVIQPQSQHSITHFHYKGKWNNAFFRNDNPIILEVGCGKGEYTTGLGKAFPDKNFIGIDIKGDRIWKGATDAMDMGLHNVAFLRIQAENINNFFDKNEISGIWLTFPDPQPGKTRIKKRLTSPWFLNRYRKLLKANSPIHLKTDDPGLYAYTLEVIDSERHVLAYHTDNLYEDPQVEDFPLKVIQTFYEQKFLHQGMPIHYIRFSLHEPGHGSKITDGG